VYDFVYEDSEPDEIELKTAVAKCPHSFLSATNRQLYRETAELQKAALERYWRSHEFIITTSSYDLCWKSYCVALRNICVRLRSVPFASTMQRLQVQIALMPNPYIPDGRVYMELHSDRAKDETIHIRYTIHNDVKTHEIPVVEECSMDVEEMVRWAIRVSGSAVNFGAHFW
jgi:hypothetical protein